MSSLSPDDKKYRKKIFFKINKISKKDLYYKIYQIILDNKEIHTINNHGVLFDIYKISMKSINSINNILHVDNITTEEESNKYQNLSESITETNDDKINLNQTALPISQSDKL